jgi:dihydrofolate reductase
MQPLAMILALAENDALGCDGALPWYWPEDRAHFERQTRGHAVIMGRRTFEETGAPLADRHTIVVSRAMAPRSDVDVVSSLTHAIKIARTIDDEPFVLGGVALFEEALPQVTRVVLTRLPIAPRADVFYRPDLSAFEVMSERAGRSGARFIELRRVRIE